MIIIIQMIAGKVLEKIIKLYHKVLSTTTTAYFTPCNRHERDKIVKAEEILVFPKYEIKKEGGGLNKSSCRYSLQKATHLE